MFHLHSKKSTEKPEQEIAGPGLYLQPIYPRGWRGFAAECKDGAVSGHFSVSGHL